MILRFIYKSCHYFWYAVISLLLVATLFGGLLFLFFQIPFVQQKVAGYVENQVSGQIQGELHIGRLEGFLPFNATVTDVSLLYRDELNERTDTVLAAGEISVSLVIRDLARGRLNVDHVKINEPTARLIKLENEYSLQRALARSNDLPERDEDAPDDESEQGFLSEIFLPTLNITGGHLYIDSFFSLPDGVELPEPFTATDISLSGNVELNDRQRFIGLSSLYASVPQLDIGFVQLRGQFYSDERFTELNRIVLETASSRLDFTAEADGLNIFLRDKAEQLQNTDLRLRIHESVINPDEWAQIYTEIPETGYPVALELDASGTMRDLSLGNFYLVKNNAVLSGYGTLENFHDPESLAYSLNIDQLQASYDELKFAHESIGEMKFRDWDKITLRGKISGGIDHIKTDITLFTDDSEAEITAEADWKDRLKYAADVKTGRIKLDQFASLEMPESVIDTEFSLRGEGIQREDMDLDFGLFISDSKIDNVVISDLEFTGVMRDGFLEPDLNWKNGGGSLQISGWIDLQQEEPRVNLTGRTDSLNISTFFVFDEEIPTSINSRFSIDTQGFSADRFQGDIFVQLRESMYNEYAIAEHEIIFDLDSPDQEYRTLRIDGTLLEAEITGSIVPSKLVLALDYWAEELNKTVQDRSLYDDAVILDRPAVYDPSLKEQINLDIRARIDDLDLLAVFLPGFPEIRTVSNLDMEIRSDREKLSINTELFADHMEINNFYADSVSFVMTSNFEPGNEFGFFSSRINANFAEMLVAGRSVRNTDLVIDAYDEAIVLQRMNALLGEDAQLNLAMSTVFSRRDVDIRVDEFIVGNDEYSWQNVRQTPIRIDTGRRIHIPMLELGSVDERILVDGVFSETDSDSVTYLLSNVQLGRISDLIGGETSFSGNVNGVFSSQTIRTAPTFFGDLHAEKLMLNENLVGDLSITSRYSGGEELFEIALAVETDEEKYAEYIERAEGRKQDMTAEGYFRTPASREPGDDGPLVHLEFDFKELDLWFVPLIVSDIFEDIKGGARGSGFFSAWSDTFDFDAEFEVIDVLARPVFLNPQLTLNGPILLNREDGVVFDNIQVRDNRNGTGVFRGYVDLNDFDEVKPLDLTLEMNNLNFLNNSFDPDSPFYGDISGTGVVNLNGTNRSALISTTETIRLTSTSQISIPVLDETSVDQQSRFIEFVDSFDQAFRTPEEDEIIRTVLDDLGFTDVFRLDLNFSASQPMSVRLIFDEVTGEIMNARGTGRLRVTLQDDDFQMFGRFDVTEGEYQFVGGDIFTKRFTLRDGGTIILDGAPLNTRVNITAAYRARPNIAVLRPGYDPEGDEIIRVPVDLILEITGTLESIENDFFFEFPSAMDAAQNATYLSVLNSDPQQKLFQATMLLFTGNFSPDPNLGGENFSQTAGQIGLNTLLSAQINNLLNSNISNLDIDLTLSGLDQADLGIALRLFDDRLILRREGIVTGEQANIGDFDVTYRINQYFSVEVFYRQDPMLPGFIQRTQGQFESVSGVGFEARIQYNTWSELRRRVTGSVGRLVGRRSGGTEEAAAQDADPEPDEDQAEQAE